jgi:oligoendopeptidase F
MKKAAKTKKGAKGPVWNLGLLYKSPEDPQIEKDMQEIEQRCADFAKKYQNGQFLKDEDLLLQSLKDYEKLCEYIECKPFVYFYFLRDIESSNPKAAQAIQLISSRSAKAGNLVVFYEVEIGKLSDEDQKKYLNSKKLSHYKVLLQRIFVDAKHTLSVAEEKIMNLKNLPADQMWSDANEKILNKRSVKWKGKTISLSEGLQKIHDLPNAKERYKLDELVSEKLKEVGEFAEAEINAVYTNKKIDDELRGYKLPYENTVRSYRNDKDVVEQLVKTTTEAFPLAHRFFKIKSKILKLKKLKYADRKIGIGKINKKFTFAESVEILKKILNDIDPKYAEIFSGYLKNGQIDVPPRVGKTSGAYCFSTYRNPTFVLLNHTDTFDSFSTLAHEMGHAFHGELCQKQGTIYSSYSTSLAESASTLFETLAVEEVSETLSDKEKIIALHDRINDDIQTIFRQIACFNFEKDLHQAIRSKGYLTKEEIGWFHNKNMKAYLGPLYQFTENDGYFFVTWSHIRRFFYVYSYAYGQLVSKALVRRYRQDKKFWSKIEQYLSAGGKDSPENILKEIGLDVTKPEFWKEGLKELEENIIKLEKLVAKKK